jgi:membrane protein DedA with SNARE-associated domain
MNFPIFLLLTGLGAGLWCLALLLLGYYFGQDVVDIISKYTKEVSIVVVIMIIVWGIWFLRKKK